MRALEYSCTNFDALTVTNFDRERLLKVYLISYLVDSIIAEYGNSVATINRNSCRKLNC